MIFASNLLKKTCLFFLSLIFISGSTRLSPQTDSPEPESIATVETLVPSTNFFSDSRLVSIVSRPLTEADKDTQGIRVQVKTTPSHATIQLDKFTAYSSPLQIDTIPDGTYTLLVSADGYRPFSYSLTIQTGYQYLLEVALTSRDGFLSVKANHEIQILEVDGANQSTDFPLQLRQGFHSVKARSFGYKDYETKVLIVEGFLIRLNVTFAEAPFVASDVKTDRSSFRPANPGRLGITTISFEVTNNGKAYLAIRDVQGNLVHEDTIDQFSNWSQHFEWNGRNPTGESFAEGPYTYTITATGDGAQTPIDLSGIVSIDNSAVVAYRSMFSGVSGIALVGDTLTLPPESYQLSSFMEALIPTNSNQVSSFDFAIYGITGTIKDLELSGLVNVATDLGSGSANINLLGAIKYTLLRKPGEGSGFGLALSAGGSGIITQAAVRQFEAVLPGVFLSSQAELSLGPINLLIEPGFQIGPWNPDGSSTDTIGSWQPRFQLSSGLSLGNEWIRLGLSARTWFPNPLPVRVALSLQGLSPQGFSIGLWGNAQFGTSDLALRAGVDLGFIH